ncbi:YeiH family protein [Marilutibacter maris]|uniref:Membrane protein n=1 Tax=Marilutibacter maris TaxID=1605891 RepID=A0A2U9TE31_9GAMM|nr:putative sulfate exporter family transporter [Lysobacter maris]AWV07849.1 membrane protein [Lysobacter maris]
MGHTMFRRLLPQASPLPGLALALLCGLAAMALATLPPFPQLHLGGLTLAIVLGLLVGKLVLEPSTAAGRRDRRLGPACAPGLAVAQRQWLRAGVVLYGLRLDLGDVLALGAPVLLLDATIVVGTLALGLWIGRRWLRLDRQTVLLTAAGSAICGAAAVLATERSLRAQPHKVAIAVATVVVFGTLNIFLYPLLQQWTGLEPRLFGVYTGATVHEVAQVVAIGQQVGGEAADTAVVVKLARVLLLVPFLLWLGWSDRRRERGRAADAGPGGVLASVPWFALGFVAMTVANTWLPIPAALRDALLVLDTVLLAAAMAALGVGTRVSSLKVAGPRPLALAGLLFLFLTLGGYGLTVWLLG